MPNNITEGGAGLAMLAAAPPPLTAGIQGCAFVPNAFSAVSGAQIVRTSIAMVLLFTVLVTVQWRSS